MFQLPRRLDGARDHCGLGRRLYEHHAGGGLRLKGLPVGPEAAKDKAGRAPLELFSSYFIIFYSYIFAVFSYYCLLAFEVLRG